jgi:hypothetical protein
MTHPRHGSDLWPSVAAAAVLAACLAACSRPDATIFAVNDLDRSVVVRVDDAAGRSRQILLSANAYGDVIRVRGLTWPATVTVFDATTCLPLGSDDLPHEAADVSMFDVDGQVMVEAYAKDEFGADDPATDTCPVT